MFDKQELAIIHRAVSEMSIKGSDAPIITMLLQKITEQHTAAKETSTKSSTTKSKA